MSWKVLQLDLSTVGTRNIVDACVVSSQVDYSGWETDYISRTMLTPLSNSHSAFPSLIIAIKTPQKWSFIKISLPWDTVALHINKNVLALIKWFTDFLRYLGIYFVSNTLFFLQTLVIKSKIIIQKGKLMKTWNQMHLFCWHFIPIFCLKYLQCLVQNVQKFVPTRQIFSVQKSTHFHLISEFQFHVLYSLH